MPPEPTTAAGNNTAGSPIYSDNDWRIAFVAETGVRAWRRTGLHFRSSSGAAIVPFRPQLHQSRSGPVGDGDSLLVQFRPKRVIPSICAFLLAAAAAGAASHYYVP